MRKKVAILLCLAMLIGLICGCNAQTRNDPQQQQSGQSNSNGGNEPSNNTPAVQRDPVELTLLVTSSDEKTANVVRDQLKKAGINVTVNVYPDSGTFNAAVDTEEYDMMVRGYSGAGSPDANVRGPFHSNGGWNTTGHNDPEIDALIDEASRLTDAEALEVYKKLETTLIEDKALTVPLYSTLKTYAVFDVLNEGLEKPFTTIAADKYDVDADAGKYQVVHIRLTEQYPQQLVTLSAGQISIVCMDRIEEVNKGIDVSNYDPNTHVLYGDPSTLKQGADHGVYFSGPYVLNYVDDYGSYLERNPGWNPEAEDAAKIRYVDMLAISDNSTQTAAFRNGELDEAMPGGENIALCEADENINMVKTPSVSVTSVYPILRGNSKMLDENLRKAVLYAINTDEIIAVMGKDNYVPANSNLIMLDTGYRFQQDLAKSAEYLEAYYQSIGE